MKFYCFIITASVLFLSHNARALTYSYPDLVSRLTDLQQLASLPAPGETTSLASSYDRLSRYDAEADKYIAWDANADGSGFVRKEGDAIVMADIQGPGCIQRMWSATAGAGHVRIYLDGSPTPAIDLPFSKFFDGTTAPFNRPNLVYTAFLKEPSGVPEDAVAGGNNYTPIPFAKSCKIVADPGWGRYYQFTYAQFPAGTVVPTLRLPLSPADASALDEADKILGRCGQEPTEPSAGTKVDRASITAGPGKVTTVADLGESGAITSLQVKLDLPADAEAQRILLRQLTISIRWDDDKEPAVWSPLGDFFGFVGGAEKFQSLPVGITEDGTFYSNWYMPFGRGAHIEVGNDGAVPVSMVWEVAHAPLTKPITTLARFHAKWHRDAFLTARKDRAIDWTLLTTRGVGRFVGTHLHGWNPRGGWWGEGDDKLFVDEEKFPSSFGTGSEDYFGYAWSSSKCFSRPYHNQILNEDNKGHFDDNRWHIPDSVPFQKSFEGDIEKYYPNSRSTLYAAEVFWYLGAGGSDPYAAVPMTDRIGYWVRPEIYHEPDAIEGESLRPLSKPVHYLGTQEMFGYGKDWSGDAQLYWRPVDPGETLELSLPAQKAGKYVLKAHYTKGPDYGVFQVNLNGTDLGGRIDLYAPTVRVADMVDLGNVTLGDGVPVLKVTFTDKNATSGGTVFGLDYLKLVPTP